jgi:hypothetical protein
MRVFVGILAIFTYEWTLRDRVTGEARCLAPGSGGVMTGQSY